MSAHGQTITWGTHIGGATQGVRGHWLQRLRRWLADRAAGNNEVIPMTLSMNWNSRREQFQPPRTESALEHAATRGGQSWFITLHSAAL
jgi:hypothetical protein